MAASSTKWRFRHVAFCPKATTSLPGQPAESPHVLSGVPQAYRETDKEFDAISWEFQMRTRRRSAGASEGEAERDTPG